MLSYTISVLPSEFQRGEKKIKEALAENHLEAILPQGLGDYLISNIQASQPYVSYRENMTVEEILKILAHYDIVPMGVWKGVFCHHIPTPEYPRKDSNAELRGLSEAEMRVHYCTENARGSSGAELMLFAQPKGQERVVRLGFRLKWVEELFAPMVNPVHDRLGKRTHYTFIRNPTLQALSALTFTKFYVDKPNWECQFSYLIDNVMEWTV